MNDKLKWILISGGLGWGIPFALLTSALRWIENQPPAFGSLPIFFVVCVFSGIGWGFFTYKLDKKRVKFNISFLKYIKSLFLLGVALCIYGILFRYVFIPNELDGTFFSTFIFIILMFLVIFIQMKFILKKVYPDLFNIMARLFIRFRICHRCK